MNGYIKFYGPSADNGKIDIEKAGKVLITTGKVFQKFIKIQTKEGKIPEINKGEKISLQTYEITNNCTSIQITTEIIGGVSKALESTPAEWLAYAQIGKTIWDNLGLKEFCNKFMGTLGEQLALKKLAKGKDLKQLASKMDQDKGAQVTIGNEFNEKKVFSLLAWQLFLVAKNDLNDIFALEEGKEEKMVIGYVDQERNHDTGSITYKEKKCFNDYSDYNITDKLKEDFEEEQSFQQTIIGRFIDYYGMAHKYHFSFQARKYQDQIGKQKIICMVDPSKISEILDLLKPENDKNIMITGKATKDFEGKIDKIKIEEIMAGGQSLFE